MATYTDSYGFDKGSAGIPAYGLNEASVVEIELDFAAITTARSAAGATALTDGDILEVISVPAKTAVLAVSLDVTTAEGGTCTVDIGDGATADGYLDGVNANTTASYCHLDGATDYATGKYYSAADTIDLKMVNAMDTAVVKLRAFMVRMG